MSYYGTLGMNEEGSAADVRIDHDTEGLVVTPDIHNAIHRDQVFEHTFTASASTSGAFFIYSGSSDQNHISIVEISTGGPNVYLRFYEASGTSSGMSSSGFSASAHLKNRNRSTGTDVSSARAMTASGVFASTSATLLDTHYIGGGTGTGGNKSGGTGPGDEEWVLKANTYYAWKYELAVEQVVNVRLMIRDYNA